MIGTLLVWVGLHGVGHAQDERRRHANVQRTREAFQQGVWVGRRQQQMREWRSARAQRDAQRIRAYIQTHDGAVPPGLIPTPPRTAAQRRADERQIKQRQRARTWQYLTTGRFDWD